MATDNKGVMVYLPPELETLLEKYCIDRSITRKTRDGHVFASLGTGIVQYLKSQLLGAESDSNIRSSTSLTKVDVLELIRENNTSNLPSEILTREEVERLITTNCDFSANTEGGAKLIDGLIKSQLEPLAFSLTELETYIQNQFKAVQEQINALSDRSVETSDSIAITPTTPAKTTDKDLSIKSWAEFFQMVGIEALKATEAQKKENIDTRTKQSEQGLKAAKEQGLGEWTVKVAGRSFVRVGD